MGLNNKAILGVFISMSLLGCGVKGKPMPPLTPAPIGRGEPTFKDANTKPIIEDENTNKSKKQK